MFPLNDFNFVACALATVSAAVGYRVSRGRALDTNGSTVSGGRTPGKGRFGFLRFQRRNSTASARSISTALTELDGSETTASECSTPRPVESQSSTIPKSSYELHEGPLKRKRSVSTTVNEDPASPPLKRQKTPEMEDHEQVAADVMAIMPSSPAPADTITQAPTDTAVEFDVDPSKAEPEIVPELTTEKIVVEEPSCQTEPPRNIDTVPRAFSWSTAQTIVAAKPSAAFNAFSGATSAFANVSTASSRAAPAWSASVGDINTIAPTSGSDPLAALSYATSTQTIVTGEEDERVIAEVKGAKVYIKRGERDFCEGILGNVKLLRHKDSRQERILFRREPVMKVSMNVRLQPLVRCTFDEAQGLLRVTLKEPIEGSQQDQVVVYAMKRGQSSKADFADFAHSVLESSRLCAQASA
ncbi:hypothetical protein PYCCODRAFT_1475421 [Trametes coccinea BRFM310]|uniref:RanBD1 domain-containing protein n=1 Tax=Trametes coccinea (strain BRFM310) TaxID=1353009 RepID=A0A1Y2IYT7_TRAC3|nr:hypothetical protein PYCCODRAFT_1475421 [Trametes coccinea BRFM310]